VTHRVYRLAIESEAAPEVRRVADFDGPASLHRVHEFIERAFQLPGADLYAFFLSGRYWDTATEYVDPRAEGRRADKALLFRLGLTVDKRFAYVADADTESERRFSVTVTSVSDVPAPLGAVVLVESAGSLPPLELRSEGSEDDEPPPEFLVPLVPFAEAIFALDDALNEPLGEEPAAPLDDALNEPLGEEPAPPLGLVTLLRRKGEAALELSRVLNRDVAALWALDDWFMDRGLLQGLFALPQQLAEASETELAVKCAEALSFCAPDEFNGDLAWIEARGGHREAALARVASNLEHAVHPYVAEGKAGDVYRALGEDDAAEVYYRRSVTLAVTSSERSEAALRLTSFLLDTGRDAAAAAFASEMSRAAETAARSVASPPAPGRNDPCPCGSGKKYKKCHGTGG
jgi:uncharacterized protein YchJ